MPSTTAAAPSGAGAAPGHYRWWIIGLLFVITTINYMDRNLLGVLKPTIQGDLHFTETDYGNIVFAFSMAYAAGYASMGAFSDKVGIRIGLGWAKSHSFHTGQCPVMKYNRQLMQCILHDKIKIAKNVNVQTITLDDAPKGDKDFDKGAAKKFVIDPHGMVA